MSTVPDVLYHMGGVPVVGGVQGQAMGRSFGSLNATQNGRTKVVYVDKDVEATREGYESGTGKNWADAISTVQAGINAARYNYGTTTLNYDDEMDLYVLIAPGDYSSEGRIAFSTGGSTHIIGIGQPASAGGDSGVYFFPETPSTFAFGGGGTGLELANITIKLQDASKAAFYWQNLENAWIHDNIIMCEGETASIGMDIYQAKGALIERNRISGPITAGIDFNYTAATYEYVANTIVRDNYLFAGGTCTDAIKVHANLVGPCFFINNHIAGNTFTQTIDCTGTTAGEYVTIANYLVGTTSAAQGTTIRGDVSS